MAWPGLLERAYRLSFFLFHGIGNSPQPDIGLGPLQPVSQTFEDSRDYVFLAVLIAARAHAERHYGIDLLFHFAHQANDLFGALDRYFDFDDGGKNLLL